MPDLAQFFGDDLQVSASGDLLTVDGLDMTTQRLIRRLMTPIKGYIWNLNYGAGVPQQIGDNINIGAIKSLITSQIFTEKSVSANPPPIVSVTSTFDSVSVTVQYTSASTGAQETLSFSVSN